MTAEIRVEEYIQTTSGFWWCRLGLDPSRFERTWVCCPGDTKELALEHAKFQAEMVRLEHFTVATPLKEAVERSRTRREPRARVSTPPKSKPARTREAAPQEPIDTGRLSLKERLKQRNADRGAA